MNTTTDQSSSQVSPEAPWLGLRPFTEALREYFFGRDGELADLFERIAQKSLTVLFGQSGLGKTSLLQAALIPRLRHAGFVPILLRLDHRPEDPPLEQQVLEALRAALDPEATSFPDLNSRAPVWRLLHDPAHGLCRPGAPRVVLLLDQFEEIFTLGETTPERRADSHAFLSALAEIVENRVPMALRRILEDDEGLADRLDYAARPLQVLLSLREDFLHRLERWRPEMPRLMDNRFELRLLTGPQALQAVIEPGRIRCRAQPDLPPIVDRQTGEEIVRFVAGVKSDVPLAEIDAVPPLLSLLCAELNAQRGQSPVIRVEQLSGRAEDILAQFYARCFAAHPSVVRRFVEERLLSPEGFRQNANEDTFLHELSGAGLAVPEARRILNRLVDDRLLVSEERGNVRRIELTHDTLTGVACRSRDLRHQSEAAARRRRQRLVWIAVGTSLLLLVSGVSVPLAIWALREKSRALEAKMRAEAETQRAEDALQRIRASEQAAVAAKETAVASRKAADELIRYMQYDLRKTLAEVGRLSLVRAIDDRIARYHREHPPQEGDLKAERERGVMLRNRGDVLVAQGQLDEALKAYRDSLALVERLAKTDPGNADWQRDLSISYDNVGNVLRAQGQLDEALKAYRDSLAIRERLAKADLDNADRQRDLSVSYNVVGNVLEDQRQLDEALKAYRDSLAIVERLAKADPNNVGWQRDLSISYDNVGNVLEAQGHLDEALKADRDSLAIRERLANAYPDNTGWQRDLSVSYEKVGNVLEAQRQLNEALKAFRYSLAIREKLVKADPENAVWQQDLSISYQNVGNVAQSQARWIEAADAFSRQVEIARPWLQRAGADVQWISVFVFSAGKRWEVLRDAPRDAVKLNRSQVLADLRTACARLRELKDQGRLVPPMDRNLPWIEGLLKAAEGK